MDIKETTSSQISKFEAAGGEKKPEFDINKMGVLWRQCSAALVATSLFHVMKLYYI